MTPGVSEAGRLTPGGRGGRRPVGRDPSQPARLPVEPLWIRRITPWLLGVAVILPALSVATELAIRPDDDDLRRIAAIQKAGAETAEGTVVSVGRRTWDDPKVARSPYRPISRWPPSFPAASCCTSGRCA